jgi:CRP/FNR family transcriptional regulator, dissimilatory nitrate respiration regulator
MGVESPAYSCCRVREGVHIGERLFSGEHMGSSSATRQQVRTVFRQCQVLAEVSDAALEKLAQSARIKRLAKGEAFVREGVSPDYFGILLNGHVRSVHFAHDGRPVTLLVGWPGDAVCLMSMLANRPVQTDIEAAEPTDVAVISRASLESLLAEEPRLSLSLLSDCTRQLFEVMGVVKSMSVDVKGRVAGYILQRIPVDMLRSRGEIKMDLAVTRVELAAELGTVPETLSRAFAALQDEGVITTRGRSAVVLDVAMLELIASGDASERSS